VEQSGDVLAARAPDTLVARYLLVRMHGGLVYHTRPELS